jgi:hypothetical protein
MKVPDFSTDRDFRTGDRIASLHVNDDVAQRIY